MRSKLFSLALVVAMSGLVMTGCAAMRGQKATEVVYESSLGPETIAYNNGIYQTRGEALPLRQDQLSEVGQAEGYKLYRLSGGGAGGAPQGDILYIKTADGRYQALVRIQ
ncbi:MAG TPA: hypothetical protein V6D05_11000 [Stenomitos sp.]